jgi:alpha-tubulin suppressor-like RCC1 family protein
MLGQDGKPLSPPPFLAKTLYLDAYPDQDTDLALASDGTVWAHLHDAMDPHHLTGTDTPKAGEQPITFVTNTPFTGLLKGWESSESDLSACALGGGELWCWGDNSHHQVSPSTVAGDPNHGSDHEPPTATVIASETIQQACVGANHVCAVTQSGGLYCWGRNASGQSTGTPGFTDIAVPTVPTALDPTTKYQQVGCGGQHTCALLADGSGVHCWGLNTYGQLGDGLDQLGPGLHTVALPGIKAISKLVVGYQHACILHDVDQVSCWGNSALGQVGGGVDSWFPTPTTFVQKAP